MDDLTVTRGVTIPARELSWTAVTSGGPGGQHVNKVATKVSLRWDPHQSNTLPRWARERLLALASRLLDAEGCLQIVSAATRSQDRNLALARERLAALIRAALTRPKVRRATKPTRASKRRRVANKRHLSQKKAGRRVQNDD